MSSSYLLDDDDEDYSILSDYEIDFDGEDTDAIPIGSRCTFEYRNPIPLDNHSGFPAGSLRTPSPTPPMRLSPKSALFTPVNGLTYVSYSVHDKASSPSATSEEINSPTPTLALRAMILAAIEGIEKPSGRKRKRPRNPPALCIKQGKKESINKDETKFEISEDPSIDKIALFKSHPELVLVSDDPPPSNQEAAVLGQLSATKLNKLCPFKFTPAQNADLAPRNSPNDASDYDTFPEEDLAYDELDVAISSDGDHFELDEHAFAQLLASEDTISQSTPRTNKYDLQRLNSKGALSSSATPTPTPKLLSANGPHQPQFKTPSRPLQSVNPKVSPFLRSTLPPAAPQGSQIPSLAAHRRIPTLFRIAEVHRLLSTLSAGTSQRIELYATINSSHREHQTKTQSFVFADLFFPSRPPYLQGSYAAWKICKLFDEDSGTFLDENGGKGRLCRAIVEIKKDNNNSGARAGSSPLRYVRDSPGGGQLTDALQVDVLNIWEATWEDVEYTRGIVGA